MTDKGNNGNNQVKMSKPVIPKPPIESRPKGPILATRSRNLLSYELGYI